MLKELKEDETNVRGKYINKRKCEKRDRKSGKKLEVKSIREMKHSLEGFAIVWV